MCLLGVSLVLLKSFYCGKFEIYIKLESDNEPFSAFTMPHVIKSNLKSSFSGHLGG